MNDRVMMVNAMQENKTETMSDKLFDLCEQQLLSIIDDAEVSITKIINSTSAAVDESADLHQLLDKTTELSDEDKAKCSGLQQKVGAILVNMQCFDELSQRIQHIKEIVRLIKIESDREGFLSDPKDSEELFKDISNIFSIRSEFEVLEQIFPETTKTDAGEMVELF